MMNKSQLPHIKGATTLMPHNSNEEQKSFDDERKKANMEHIVSRAKKDLENSMSNSVTKWFQDTLLWANEELKALTDEIQSKEKGDDKKDSNNDMETSSSNNENDKEKEGDNPEQEKPPEEEVEKDGAQNSESRRGLSRRRHHTR